MEMLAHRMPAPRQASLALLRDPTGGMPLDRSLLLWLPGPHTVTGEVIDAVEAVLSAIPGLRRAQPGEFTRRAFDHGRMDLNAVEGLSDLLAAETQSQRRAALSMAEGHFSRRIDDWRARLLALSAMAEAALDFSDEDDVPDASIEDDIAERLSLLEGDVRNVLSAPSAERLRDGIRVVLAGPPNAGKSTLLNALVGRDAAIVSAIAGTTRDRIEVPAAIDGVAYLFTDTAGLRDDVGDDIEAIGIDRARAALEAADIILWLGAADAMPRPDAILIAAQSDRQNNARPGLPVSALTGENMGALLAPPLFCQVRGTMPSTADNAIWWSGWPTTSARRARIMTCS